MHTVDVIGSMIMMRILMMIVVVVMMMIMLHNDIIDDYGPLMVQSMQTIYSSSYTTVYDPI